MNKEQSQTYTCSEEIDGFHKGRGVCDWAKRRRGEGDTGIQLWNE